jgi:hypothetical protein
MLAHVLLLEAVILVHVLRVTQEIAVNQMLDQVNFILSLIFIYILIYLAVCDLSCSPGYCFANPSGQPAFACYCADNTINLNTCVSG